MEKLSRSFGQLNRNEGQEGSSNVNYGFFPPLASNPDPVLSYPNQGMPSYMYPYQNYMNASLNNSIFEDYNKRGGGMLDQLIVVQSPSDPAPSNEEPRFKQEEVSEKDGDSESGMDKTEGCFCGESGDQTLIKCNTARNSFTSNAGRPRPSWTRCALSVG
jgi:hypothetical protein